MTYTDDQVRWHRRAIAQILASWQAGELTTEQKRRAIADENQRHYRDDPHPNLTRAGHKYALPSVLAQATGTDPEMMRAALNARRDGGVEAFEDVLAAAGTLRRKP